MTNAQGLTLARRQYEAQVEAILADPPRLDWEVVAGRRHAGARSVDGRRGGTTRRLLIAAAACLTVGGSAAYALIGRGAVPAKRAHIQTPTLQTLVPHRKLGPPPVLRRAAARRRIVHPVVEKRPPVHKRVVFSRRPAKPREPVVRPTRGSSPHPQAESGRFSDEVIIVVPPAKMKPLFSPEDYKRKGPFKSF